MPCKTKPCQSSRESHRMVRAMPLDTPKPPKYNVNLRKKQFLWKAQYCSCSAVFAFYWPYKNGDLFLFSILFLFNFVCSDLLLQVVFIKLLLFPLGLLLHVYFMIWVTRLSLGYYGCHASTVQRVLAGIVSLLVLVVGFVFHASVFFVFCMFCFGVHVSFQQWAGWDVGHPRSMSCHFVVSCEQVWVCKKNGILCFARLMCRAACRPHITSRVVVLPTSRAFCSSCYFDPTQNRFDRFLLFFVVLVSWML